MRNRNQKTGDKGEKQVVRDAPCPNCGKRMTRLPKCFPLYDVQCKSCSFRAQVKTKTGHSSGKFRVRGGGWNIMRCHLKAGGLPPPLILNFPSESKMLFFPCIPKSIYKKYKLRDDHPQPNYEMFDYSGLNALPHFELTKSGKRKSRKWIPAEPKQAKPETQEETGDAKGTLNGGR